MIPSITYGNLSVGQSQSWRPVQTNYASLLSTDVLGTIRAILTIKRPES
jgi:hypothetical protein